MKEIGKTESGDPVYEVPPNLMLAVEHERRRKEQEAAKEQARRHQESIDVARSSTRAAWAAVWISIAALAVSFVAFFWTARGG